MFLIQLIRQMTADQCLTGLFNLGNTCYINSSIQALYATQQFRDYILSHRNKGPLHYAVSQLFKMMATDRKERQISPLEFINKFRQFKPQFKVGEQQDSQEFLRFIIDGIHEEVNDAKPKRSKRIAKPEPKTAVDAWKLYLNYTDDSFLVKLFVGQLTSVIKCTDCQNQSYCWDTFWDISVSLPKGDNECDIIDCIKEYTAEEVLDSDSMPNCSNCGQKTKSTKSLKFEKCPLILIIQLKKFGNDGHKISKNVKINDEILINNEKYVLYACVCHLGTTCWGGHYNSFCKSNSEKWFFFDDESVSFDKYFATDHLNDAYILFYRMETNPMSQILS
jgi:ubiquitin C-terminal hydrolase